MSEYDAVERHASDPFVEARREQQKLRLAIDGPSGSGKTYTGLIAGTVLVDKERELNPDAGGIAVIDTENGSAALYANEFEFKHAILEPPFSPARYIARIRAAVEFGYSVVIIDSLSHGWNADGGVLSMVDDAKARVGGNQWAAWREGTPAQNALIASIVQSPIHIIATLRTKQEWVLETQDDGSKTPKRVGMAPVQRDGIEYEFTIVGDMDLEHRLVVSKSRATPIADKVVIKPGPTFFGEVVGWLHDGTPMANPKHREKITALTEALTESERAAANAWFLERRYRMASLSAEEADETIANLEALITLRLAEAAAMADGVKNADADGVEAAGDPDTDVAKEAPARRKRSTAKS